MTDLDIRPADWLNSRETLLSIRFEVFVNEQGVPPELEEDAHDPLAFHLLARNPAGIPAATGRLLPDGRIGRMAVIKSLRGQGLGSALLARLIERARQNGLKSVFLDAQCSAEPFYVKHGFIAEGEIFEDAGIPHRRMRKTIGKPA